MINLHNVLLRLAEPFIDATYSKVLHLVAFIGLLVFTGSFQIDRIDPHYLSHSTRLNVQDETRIKATNEEVKQWSEEIRSTTSSVIQYRIY